jgi:type IV pilus assembly protein PilM
MAEIKDLSSLKNKINLKKIKDIITSFKKEISVIGLDIGTFSIKSVEIKKKWPKKETSLSYSIVNIAKPEDSKSIISAIRESLKELGCDSARAKLSLSGPDIITRYILLPKMQEKDLLSSLEFELLKHIPHKLEEMVVDYQVIDRSIDNQMLVLVVAAERRIIADRVNLIKQAGLEPKSINVDCFAIVEAFQRISPMLGENNASVALLDIGHRTTKLAVLENNDIRFSREIMMGGYDLTRTISERMNVDLEQAEKLKCSQDEKSSEIKEIINSNLEGLLDEIRLSLDYCQRLIQKRISSLYLSGGGARLKDIDTVLNSALELKINFWDPLINFHLAPSASKQTSESKSSLLATAVGLALS